MPDSPIAPTLRILSEATRRGAYRDAPVYDGPIEKRETPFQTLVGCIISQRVRDQQTGVICRRLFALAATPEAMLTFGRRRLERELHGAGFFRQKTLWILELARIVSENGVPETREGLMALPGIGPKCANIVLATRFGKPYIAVDTHVHRISNRLGWVETKTPEKTEAELTPKVPTRWRRRVNVLLVAHGQLVCQPVRPKCGRCPVLALCAQRGVDARGQTDNIPAGPQKREARKK